MLAGWGKSWLDQLAQPPYPAWACQFSGCWQRERAVAHLLGESRRLFLWLHAKLCGHDSTARLVLGQRRRTLTVVGQEEHLLAVGLFPPGLQKEQTPGSCQPDRIRAFSDAAVRQPAQPTQHHPVVMFPLHKQPILENWGVAYRKAFQQPAPVEGGCLRRLVQIFPFNEDSKVVRTTSTSSQWG